MGILPGEVVVKMKNNNNEWAVITGASSGIGRAVAKHLAAQGKNVLLISRNQKKLGELREELLSQSVEVYVAAGDVADAAFIEKTFEDFLAQGKSFNHLILCAGEAFIKPFNKTTLDDFEQLINSNMLGVVHCCKFGLKNLKAGGNIIMMVSPAGIYGAKGMTAYALSKGGLLAFGKCLALEVAPKKIRVNMISAGYVKTNMTESLYGNLPETLYQQIVERYPLGVGDVQDVVNCIDFLISEQAKWITGAVFPVDGGFTAGI